MRPFQDVPLFQESADILLGGRCAHVKKRAQQVNRRFAAELID